MRCCKFVPEEERVQYSAMTGQSLFYMGEMDLKNKVLAIVEEEGASRAAYALKLLQSEGVLTIASTGKDPATGKLVTHQYRVEGPVMMFLTTTAIDLDEELLNRCLVLSVNEEREQTQAIHRLQREQQTLEGLLKRQERRDIVRLHQNAQRLLRPLFVANPYACKLTFLDRLTRTRRDHAKKPQDPTMPWSIVSVRRKSDVNNPVQQKKPRPLVFPLRIEGQCPSRTAVACSRNGRCDDYWSAELLRARRYIERMQALHKSRALLGRAHHVKRSRGWVDYWRSGDPYLRNNVGTHGIGRYGCRPRCCSVRRTQHRSEPQRIGVASAV